MVKRIELYERYISNADQVEQMIDLGCTKYLIEHKYRRTNPRMDEVERIIEIPGNIFECEVLFYSGEIITVKAQFDELCILFNDLENNNIEDDEEINN